jgi:hypothetical protein
VRSIAIVVAAAVVAAVLATTAGASPEPAQVTQAAIGGVRLGLTASGYAHALREQPFVTRYENETRRLFFPRAELSVYLDRKGRGTRITTAAPEYTLGRGLGPCGLLTSLARARRLVPVRLAGPFGSSATVYREGRLWFTLANATHVGSVTLAAGRPALSALVAEAQCGVGDEEGE